MSERIGRLIGFGVVIPAKAGIQAFWFFGLLILVIHGGAVLAEEPPASPSPLWVAVPLTLGTAYLIADGDQEIYRYFHDHRDDRIENISDALTRSGDGVSILGIAGLTYGVGLATDNNKAKRTAILGAASVAGASLITETIKHTAGRQRPVYAEGEDRWNGPEYFFRKDDDYFDSFPSGHATAAFALATTFALEYPGGAVPYVAYTWATGVALSRVYNEVHWTSDVLVGSAIGYCTAQGISRFARSETGKKFFLIPRITPDGWRLSLGGNFD